MPQPILRTTFVARTVLWIAISSCFLFWNIRRVITFRALGLAPSSWAYLQIALWSFALIFWLYTGWRDWTRSAR